MESGKICTASCCNGACSGPLYRIVPLVFCCVSVVTAFIAADLNHAGSEIWLIIGASQFAVFFIVDYVIQCCIIRGSKADCVGTFAGCECGCFLGSKLIFDGIYLFLLLLVIFVFPLVLVGVHADRPDRVVDRRDHVDMKLFRLLRSLIIAKIGLEIAAIVVLCKQESKQLQRVHPDVIGQPVAIKEGDEN